MNVSSWSIRHPVPPILLFVILTLLGIVSFRALPITQFPNIDIPIVVVTVTQPGAAPSELVSQVTEPVEDAISGVQGVRHILSVAAEGASTTTIEFELQTDSDRALNDVKDAVARIRSDLPATADDPIVQRLDVTGLAIMTYAVFDPTRSVEELSWFVDDTVSRELQTVKGLGKIERIGGAEREIRVELDPDRLAALNVTAADVSRQLNATSVDLAGGRGEIAGQEQSIRTLGGADSVRDLAATTISLPGGRNVRLDDLGAVRDGAAEARTFARLDGRPIIAFGVFRATGASDAEVADGVRARIKALEAAHPNLSLTLIDNTVDRTYGSFESAMHTLVEGAVLAVIVVLLFLRDWRATLVAATALPLSILPTFFVMDQLGFSLNLVSLLGVTLVTGILVDDAIVEIENIVRHTRMGKSAWRAAMEAADEIGLAVIAISVTIIAVFVPVSFMGGIAGQYFRQFGLTVAFAVFFSLAVARLLTPMMAAYLMRPGAAHEERDGFLMRAYVRIVRWTVRHRFLTLVLGFLVFAGSIWSATLLPSGFLPTQDAGRSLMAVELPPGSRLADTQALTDRVARTIRAHAEVENVFVNGGSGTSGGLGTGGGEVRKATLTINYVPKAERTRSQQDMERVIAAELSAEPDMRFWFTQDNGQRALSLVLLGDDSAAVQSAALELAGAMGRLPELANVTTSAALDRPEVQIVPLGEQAAELGISTQALSNTVRVATIGDVNSSLAKFNAGDRQIPIRVELDEAAQQDLDTLGGLRVTTASGSAVPLASVARIEFGRGPTTIERYDRQRRIAVEADLVDGAPLGAALETILALPQARELPDGVEMRESGDAEVMAEVFASFGQAMGAGILMVYAVLVLLFGSFMTPIAILLSLPLSIGGAIMALAIAGKSISLPVVIGILMLMGIVTKNAIMIVDFAIISRERGMSKAEAIVDAGHKRARPIVMTTIAMVAGMVPSAMALGEGGEFRAPMAIAVIGGLLVSTLLSLLFVPAFYSVVDSLAGLLWRLLGRFVGPGEAEEADHGRAHEVGVTAVAAALAASDTTRPAASGRAQEVGIAAVAAALSASDAPRPAARNVPHLQPVPPPAGLRRAP